MFVGQFQAVAQVEYTMVCLSYTEILFTDLLLTFTVIADVTERLLSLGQSKRQATHFQVDKNQEHGEFIICEHT